MIDSAMVNGHEATLLSRFLNDEMAIERYPDLKAQHFASPAHREIFEAILTLHYDGYKTIFPVVEDYLRRRGRLPEIGEHTVSNLAADSRIAAMDEGCFAYALDCVRDSYVERATIRIGKDLAAGKITAEQAREKLEELRKLEAKSATFAGLVELPLAKILDEIDIFFRRYIAFTSDAQPTVIALWAAHTWFIEAFDFTPYLHIYSPTMECGKSHVLECLGKLCRNVRPTNNITVAALFRLIEKERPTLLMDEVDAVFQRGGDEGNEDRRGILNAGFERGFPVLRCVGNEHEVQEFDVFCPKALAGIGRLPATIESRSIPIRLQKKTKAQIVQRLRKRQIDVRFLSGNLHRLSQKPDLLEALRSGKVELKKIGDRQNDISEPLLVLADMAGGDWPEKARCSLVELFGAKDDDDTALQLQAIRCAFRQDERVNTSDLIERLLDADNPPFPGWWLKNDTSMKSIGKSLAEILKGFKLKPKPFKVGGGTVRGYLREDFEPVWASYCTANNGQCLVSGNSDVTDVTLPVTDLCSTT